METSLKSSFAQKILLLPKKSELPKFWGGLQPPSPPRPVRLWATQKYISAWICKKVPPGFFSNSLI